MVSNPNAIRPWQHVLEPLSGYLWLGAKMFKEGENYSSAWNFGPVSTKNIIVLDLVKSIIKIWGSGSYNVDSEGKTFHEASYLKLDSHKATNRLKWEPVLEIEKAIEMTVNWYKQFYSKDKDSYNLCLEQIESYERLIETKHLYGT